MALVMLVVISFHLLSADTTDQLGTPRFEMREQVHGLHRMSRKRGD